MGGQTRPQGTSAGVGGKGARTPEEQARTAEAKEKAGYTVANGNAVTAARDRSKQIADEIEHAQGYDWYTEPLYGDAAHAINSQMHDTGEATAESYARRGLGGSGMDVWSQQDNILRAAAQRAQAIDDARAASVAKQRADLAAEQAVQIGIQTSDIGAQQLALQEQAFYDKVLADALGAVGEGVGSYVGKAQKQKDDALAAAAQARLASNPLYGPGF